VRDRLNDIRERKLSGKVECVIQAFARPVGIAQLFSRQQKYMATLALTLAHKVLSLFVRRNAEQGQWARFRHEYPFF
jgi:hypothetical protein